MTQPQPPSLRDSKARLLRLLKERRQATVAELAQALGVTRACVHSHLADLGRAQMVRLAGVVRAGRGRPEHRFELTEAGEALFPKDYAGLAGDLLELIKSHYGQGAALELLECRNAALSADWLQETEHLPLQERLERLAERLTELGYEARVEVSNDPGESVAGCCADNALHGRPALVLGNCPYPKTAAAHPEVCQAERQLHEQVLGVAVRRVSPRIVEGHGCCRYVVLPGEAPGQDIAAESGSS